MSAMAEMIRISRTTTLISTSEKPPSLLASRLPQLKIVLRSFTLTPSNRPGGGGRATSSVDTMQFPGHAADMPKSMYNSKLEDSDVGNEFHFDLGGVETLHFWRMATCTLKHRIRSPLQSGN